MKYDNPFVSRKYIQGFLKLNLSDLKKRLYNINKEEAGTEDERNSGYYNMKKMISNIK